MHGGGDGVISLRSSDAKTDGQHDRIAVGHDRDAHRLFGVMAVRHVDIVGQG
jgi:hypothetical protein